MHSMLVWFQATIITLLNDVSDAICSGRVHKGQWGPAPSPKRVRDHLLRICKSECRLNCPVLAKLNMLSAHGAEVRIWTNIDLKAVPCARRFHGHMALGTALGSPSGISPLGVLATRIAERATSRVG